MCHAPNGRVKIFVESRFANPGQSAATAGQSVDASGAAGSTVSVTSATSAMVCAVVVRTAPMTIDATLNVVPTPAFILTYFRADWRDRESPQQDSERQQTA